MFRARNPQRSLFSAKNQYCHLLKDGSFHALLSQFGEELFDDYSFEHLYCEDNGRPCIPPSQMFMLLLLQMHDGSSDEEAAGRTGWDLRWSAVLDLEPGVTLCGKTTLQEFRARVLLNETAEEQFKKSLGLARKLGIIKGPLQVALDTTPILGRGAVKDTYNLIGDGIRKLAQVLAKMEGVSAEHWAGLHDLSRYWEASSLKGEAGIDWSDDTQRRVFLNSLVADADRILLLAAQLSKSANEEWAGKITEASALLRRLIIQDTEPDPDPPSGATSDEVESEVKHPTTESGTTPSESTAETPSEPDPAEDDSSAPGSPAHDTLLAQMLRICKGTAKDRIISVHDPEMRHGRKSASNRFDGHKLSIVNDTASGLILSLDVLPGNAADNQGALDLAKQAGENVGLQVEKAIADCAYGDGATREDFKEAGIELSAKVPAPPAKDSFPKNRFELDLTNMIATCPEGKTSAEQDFAYHRSGPARRLRFSSETCDRCPHREECLRAIDKKRGWGRTIVLHPQEELLQEARDHQATPEFREDVKARQTAEHTLARCVQLGARQARYMGRRKTKFQMLMIAMVANLTKMAGAIYSKKNASLQPLQLLNLDSPCPPCPPCLKSSLRTSSRQKRALESLIFKNGGFRLAS